MNESAVVKLDEHRKSGGEPAVVLTADDIHLSVRHLPLQYFMPMVGGDAIIAFVMTRQKAGNGNEPDLAAIRRWLVALPDGIAPADVLEWSARNAGAAELAVVWDVFGDRGWSGDELLQILLERGDERLLQTYLRQIAPRLQYPDKLLEQLFSDNEREYFAVVAGNCTASRVENAEELLEEARFRLSKDTASLDAAEFVALAEQLNQRVQGRQA